MRVFAALAVVASLSACGITPTVKPGDSAAGEVKIVAVTNETISTANASPYRPRTYDDVWGLIWDGRSLFALTPQGEVLEVDWRTALVKPVYRVKATYYGACPMLRI